MPFRLKLTRSLAAAILAVSTLAAPLGARARSADSWASADQSIVRIDNFGRINENYYRGAQPVGDDYKTLAGLGIKTVINLTSHDASPDEEASAASAGLSYFHIPMTTRKVPTQEQLDEFFSIVNDPVNQPVYVHCVGGKHRTGVMTAAYRMTNDGWTSDQAFQEMKQYKYGPDFLHPEFKRFVYGFTPKPAAAQSMITR